MLYFDCDFDFLELFVGICKSSIEVWLKYENYENIWYKVEGINW